MHILFVEDEAKIANFMRAGLKEQGFVVDYCDNGDEGYTRALDNEYDALVLDIMVPEKMVCPSSKTCAGKDRMCR
jgi:DNA-binding response OmpR family regulator